MPWSPSIKKETLVARIAKTYDEERAYKMLTYKMREDMKAKGLEFKSKEKTKSKVASNEATSTECPPIVDPSKNIAMINCYPIRDQLINQLYREMFRKATFKRALDNVVAKERLKKLIKK